MIDADSQGGAEWRGDEEDGKYKRPDDGLGYIVDALNSPPCPMCAEYALSLARMKITLERLAESIKVGGI